MRKINTKSVFFSFNISLDHQQKNRTGISFFFFFLMESQSGRRGCLTWKLAASEAWQTAFCHFAGRGRNLPQTEEEYKSLWLLLEWAARPATQLSSALGDQLKNKQVNKATNTSTVLLYYERHLYLEVKVLTKISWQIKLGWSKESLNHSCGWSDQYKHPDRGKSKPAFSEVGSWWISSAILWYGVLEDTAWHYRSQLCTPVHPCHWLYL